VHLRPPLDALTLRVLVELVLGAPLGARVGALPAALRGGLVLHGGAAGLLGLALLGAGLVHGAGGDLLRLVLRGALVQLAVLDVLVLALALVAPFLGHGVLLVSSVPRCRRHALSSSSAPAAWSRSPTERSTGRHRSRCRPDPPPRGGACRGSPPAGVPGQRAHERGGARPERPPRRGTQ